MSDSTPPGLLGAMSRTEKAFTLVVGLVLAGIGAGVWFANFQTAFATADALEAHTETVDAELETLETSVGDDLKDLERDTRTEREKVWRKVNELSEVTRGTAAQVEMLLLYETRRRADFPTRSAIDRRLDELRAGGAPAPNPTDPLSALE